MIPQEKAIHARSLFPCQDSPGIKVKYTAAVTVKDPLVALMSANLQHDKTTKNGDGTSTYHFIQQGFLPSQGLRLPRAVHLADQLPRNPLAGHPFQYLIHD